MFELLPLFAATTAEVLTLVVPLGLLLLTLAWLLWLLHARSRA